MLSVRANNLQLSHHVQNKGRFREPADFSVLKEIPVRVPIIRDIELCRSEPPGEFYESKDRRANRHLAADQATSDVDRLAHLMFV